MSDVKEQIRTGRTYQKCQTFYNILKQAFHFYGAEQMDGLQLSLIAIFRCAQVSL